MENKEQKRCVVYARYSSDNQREVSAEEQVKSCKEFIERNGYICVGEYVDKELTGTNANRRQFRKMIDDSKKRLFDIVVVYKNDRFARDCYDKAFYKRKLLNNKVQINYVKEDILNSNSPERVIYEAVSDGMAEYYSLNLAREVMEKGHLPNAEKGLHNGGIPPLGYNVVGQKLVVNREEAYIVKLIFDWYINKGYGYNRIAEELNARGFKNKVGSYFKGSSIRDMLINEKYTGTYVYNKRSSSDINGKRNNSKLKDESEIIRIENAFEAIISKEDFEKVKKMMQFRKGRNATNQAKEVYLLSGLVKCGKCGHNLHGNRKPSNRDGSYLITYKCNNRDKNGKKVCDNKEINKIYLERAIMQYIARMCEGKNFDKIMKELHRYANEQKEGNAELIMLEKKFKKIEREIANIINAIKGGFDAEELQDEYKALKTDKTNLEKQIAIEKAKQVDEIIIDDIKAKNALQKIGADIYSGKPIEEYKQLFSAFVDKVEVFEDYANIVLNVFDMIGVSVQNGSGIIKTEPPLDFHQMVVWNGGGEGNRTPVRKPIRGAFSERSPSLGFPTVHAEGQAYTAGSFISSWKGSKLCPTHVHR